MTADELSRLPDDGYRYELVRGQLRRMSPGKEEHGFITGQIHIRLGMWVWPRNLGRVYSSETGFRLASNPDTVRCPDVSFVRASTPRQRHDFPPPPDIAFEVKSPSNTYKELLEKKDDYLAAGTLAVVIVDPPKKAVTVHRPNGVRTVEDILTLDDVLPGWQLPLAELFA